MTNSSAPIDARLSNRADALAHLDVVVDRIAGQYNLQRDVLIDLRIALDEVVSNILKYGYADDAAHDIAIHCEIRDGELETTIEDDGCAFDPLRAPRPDLTAPLAARKVGGLGVHFLKELMNSVTYERVDGRNRLTLRQKLDGGAA
jgi:serine/threonine-protein kinase RsbW